VGTGVLYIVSRLPCILSQHLGGHASLRDMYTPTLQHAATHCSILQYTVAHCNILQHVATDGTTLQYTTRCNTLHHTTPHCTKMQQAAIRCNTLQHDATRCYTLQHTSPRNTYRGCDVRHRVKLFVGAYDSQNTNTYVINRIHRLSVIEIDTEACVCE